MLLSWRIVLLAIATAGIAGCNQLQAPQVATEVETTNSISVDLPP
jgi:type IV pilus biogenesis protein CpaD/CtpE